MTGFSAADFDRVRAAARDALAKHRLPGLCIGIVRGNDLVFAESFGVAEIESKQPMDLTHRQCIASITKTMVGLCTMALVDERRLRLEDRVVDLLPEIGFEGPAQTMTIWHLLTHTAGIGEAQTQDMLAAEINPEAPARRKPGNFATLYERGIVIEYEPGTKWHYANHGFILLGEIIQRTEESELSDVMQRRIFGPLGMTDTDLLGENHPRLSAPHHRAPSEDTRAQLTRAGIPIRDEATVDDPRHGALRLRSAASWRRHRATGDVRRDDRSAVQPATVGECAIDARILETAPGTYELTPGKLTNFRPATGIGRIQIERGGQELSLRSRWGAWKSGVRMIACDESDPAFFALPAEDGEVSHVALTRDRHGSVTGLRCDRLVHMVRKAAG